MKYLHETLKILRKAKLWHLCHLNFWLESEERDDGIGRYIQG